MMYCILDVIGIGRSGLWKQIAKKCVHTTVTLYFNAREKKDLCLSQLSSLAFRALIRESAIVSDVLIKKTLQKPASVDVNFLERCTG